MPKNICQKEHIPKKHMQKRAHARDSTFQKEHIPKRTHAKKETMLKGAHAKNSTYKKEHNYHLSQAS